jgi:hypothetical protein
MTRRYHYEAEPYFPVYCVYPHDSMGFYFAKVQQIPASHSRHRWLAWGWAKQHAYKTALGTTRDDAIDALLELYPEIGETT